MRAVMVYESMFGNTKTVADAIADGLRTRCEVDVFDAEHAPTTFGPDTALLVAGGPTHAFGLSRTSTRKTAAKQTSTVTSTVTGLREWLDMLDEQEFPVVAATFDTRIKRRGIPGSAARALARRFARLGYPMITKPMSFWVTDTPGPLIDGEIARARAWAADLATRIPRTEVATTPNRPRRSS